MKVLSLFDGMSCGQIALERAGIKVEQYYASEIKKHAIQLTQKHYPNTIQLGDVTKVSYKDGVLYTENGEFEVGKIDLIIGGSPCFVEGTLVLTDKGYKKIEDIEKGDKVITHTNTYKEVVEPMKKKANSIYRLNTMCSEDLLVTEEHPFYVISNKGDEPKWVKVKDLKKSNLVGVAINQLSEIPVWNGIETKVNQNTTKIKNNLSLLMENENFWWMVGRYMGDGWTTITKRKNRKDSYSYKTVICCSKKNNDLKIITDKLDGIFKYSICEERTVYKITVCGGEELYKYLQQFGKYSYGKRLTGDIINLPVDLLKSFIEGYFSADGCVIKDKVMSCCSVSKELIYGIAQCVAKVYKKPYSIYKYHYNDTHVIEGRKVNQRPVYVFKYKLEPSKKDRSFYDNGYIWHPINDIKEEVFNGYVYNMEVKEDHSYTVNNIIVHNCQNFSQARLCMYEIDGLKGDKSKLFYEFLRILKEVKPDHFLLENVKMKKESYEQLNEYLGVKGIPINSELVSFQKRPRIYWTNIPNVTIPENKHINFQDYKDTDYEYCKQFKVKRTPSRERMWNNGQGRINGLGSCDNVTNSEKVYCLTRKQDRCPNSGLIEFDDFCRYLTRREIELAQTLPIGYTDGLSYNQMQDLCGDGWTVDVIAHILKGLR